MSWPMVRLGDVAPAKAIKHQLGEHVWLLNLDQVEADTGNILQKIILPASEVGASTHGFDEKHVLYSKLRPYLNKVVLPDEKGIATTELVAMLPDPERLDRKYLAYYLRSKNFVDWVSAQVAGAKMPRVSMQQFWQHEIPLPPLPEQKRIAAILDKADAIRRKRQQAIQLADDFLRAVFLDMFGDPVTNPKGLEITSIGELCDINTGATPPRGVDEYYGGNIPWVKTGEVSGSVICETEETITVRALDNSNSKLNPAGSIVIAMYGQGKTRGKVGVLGVEAATNQACAVIRPSSKVMMEYLYFYLHISYEALRSLGQGAGQPNLNLSIVKEFPVLLPSEMDQRRFVKIFESSGKFRKRSLLAAQRNSELFNALSQKHFLVRFK